MRRLIGSVLAVAVFGCAESPTAVETVEATFLSKPATGATFHHPPRTATR